MKTVTWNIPNVLSAYRLLALPFLMLAIFSGWKNGFTVLLVVNLITDILDGWIARTFKMETEFGARLDSLADIGTYIAAFTGIIVLEQAFVHAHQWGFYGLITLYASVQLIALFRFQRTTSFHLYSSKIVGYIQGIFIVTYFIFGYTAWYFYLMISCSYIAYTEALIIVALIPKMRSNVKGVYFMLRQHKRIL